MAHDERDEAYDKFKDAVNMTKSELAKWLDTDESRSVGMTAGGEKRTGTGGRNPRATSPAG